VSQEIEKHLYWDNLVILILPQEIEKHLYWDNLVSSKWISIWYWISNCDRCEDHIKEKHTTMLNLGQIEVHT